MVRPLLRDLCVSTRSIGVVWVSSYIVMTACGTAFEPPGVLIFDAGSAPAPRADTGFPQDLAMPRDAGISLDQGAADDARAPDDASAPSPACAGPFEAEVIAAANLARAGSGAGALTCAPDLAEVARAHSQDMCRRAYFSHDNPDGQSPFERMRAAGITYRAAGENIAQGQSSPGQVHGAWMNSAGHRANILNTPFGRIGVGYVECSTGARRHYWTQVFTD